MKNQPIYPENNVTSPSPLFKSALIEDYNRALDWLWVESKVTRLEERLYCLRRALYISPDSDKLRRDLDKLLREKSRSTRQPTTVFQRLIAYVTEKTARQMSDSTRISEPIS